MKILTLSDGTQINFPEAADGYSQEQLDHVEKHIISLEYPVSSISIGETGTTEYSSPDEMFSKINTFDGVKVNRVYR